MVSKFALIVCLATIFLLTVLWNVNNEALLNSDTIEWRSPPKPLSKLARLEDLLCTHSKVSFDRDIKRNFARIVEANICVSEVLIKEKSTDWHFQIFDSNRKGWSWILLHDDENTAFDAAIYALKVYGGKAIAIQSDELNQPQGARDPNRNFAANKTDAIKCQIPLDENSIEYSKWIAAQLDGVQIIALHNNADGSIHDGGRGNFAVDSAMPRMLGLDAIEGDGRLSDYDNAILFSGVKRFQNLNDAEKQLVRYLRSHGVNVVYEHLFDRVSDCSLSNFSKLSMQNDNFAYFNIEAQHGDYASQIEMIDILWKARHP